MAVLLLYISLPSPVPPVPDVCAEQKPEQLWTKFHFDILHVLLFQTLNSTLINTEPFALMNMTLSLPKLCN